MENIEIPKGEFLLSTPDETFELGEKLGGALTGGELIFLRGTLGTGKTLLTKGIVSALGFDVDEVTSPSFTLVNLYKTDRFDVYHIDLWRMENSRDAIIGIGLDEILDNEDTVIIIEWAERLGDTRFDRNTILVEISGDGDDARKVTVTRDENG